jgi:flagellar basal-body rod protein FlgB
MTLRKDGNTVDLDREMAKLSENNLMYNALAQIVSRKFQGLKDAIKGGE